MSKLRDTNKQRKFNAEEIKLNQWKISKRLELGLINNFDSSDCILTDEEKIRYFLAEQEANKYIESLQEVPADIKSILLEIKSKLDGKD